MADKKTQTQLPQQDATKPTSRTVGRTSIGELYHKVQHMQRGLETRMTGWPTLSFFW